MLEQPRLETIRVLKLKLEKEKKKRLTRQNGQMYNRITPLTYYLPAVKGRGGGEEG